MKKLTYTLALAVLISSAAMAQFGQLPTKQVEFGIRGGATFVHGYTNIPAQPTATPNVQIPALENKGDGIGTGYTAGLFGRFNNNNRKGYVQIELSYNRYVLKQRTNLTLDVNANPALAARLPISFAPGLLTATADVTSESSIESFNIPILFGRRILSNKLRAYIGPNILFVNKSEAKRTTQGQVNPNPAIGFPISVPIPATDETTNLLRTREAGNLLVRRATWALEAGLGITPLKFLDIDVRYAVPAGGVYKDTNITGFLGIATITAGITIP